MRTLNNLWTMLAARDSTKLETVAVINEAEYAAITAPEVHHSLLSSDTLTVGNCVSASLKFTVMTTDAIPPSAKVVIKSRLVDGQVYTNWYEFGTFWVSKRTVDDDLVTLECYDAMLKGNQPYGGSSDALNWPKPMSTVVSTIASRMGVQLDSRTVINSDSTVYKCEYPGEMTLLEVLGYIGACHGGNWIITPENKLRLVPLTGSGDTVNVPVVLTAITTARSYTITGISMVMDEEHVYQAGYDWGYVLTINPCPYASQAIADDLYAMLNGLTYQPFAISGAMYDPAAELGDSVVIGNVQSALFIETRTYDIDFTADAQAPGRDEMEDEYPYPSQLLKMQNSIVALNTATARTRTAIEQTQRQVSIVAENYVGKDGVRAAFSLDPSNIVLEAGVDEDDNPTGTITMKAGTLIVEGDNFSVDADGHMKCNGAEINGDMTCGDENALWAKLEDGELKGGYGNSQRGFINFAAVTEDLDTHQDRYGIQISGDILRISTNKIAISDRSDTSVNATWTKTRYSIPIVTDIRDIGNGQIGWKIGFFDFINGMLTGLPDISDYYHS